MSKIFKLNSGEFVEYNDFYENNIIVKNVNGKYIVLCKGDLGLFTYGPFDSICLNEKITDVNYELVGYSVNGLNVDTVALVSAFGKLEEVEIEDMMCSTRARAYSELKKMKEKCINRVPEYSDLKYIGFSYLYNVEHNPNHPMAVRGVVNTLIRDEKGFSEMVDIYSNSKNQIVCFYKSDCIGVFDNFVDLQQYFNSKNKHISEVSLITPKVKLPNKKINDLIFNIKKSQNLRNVDIFYILQSLKKNLSLYEFFYGDGKFELTKSNLIIFEYEDLYNQILNSLNSRFRIDFKHSVIEELARNADFVKDAIESNDLLDDFKLMIKNFIKFLYRYEGAVCDYKIEYQFKNDSTKEVESKHWNACTNLENYEKLSKAKNEKDVYGILNGDDIDFTSMPEDIYQKFICMQNDILTNIEKEYDCLKYQKEIVELFYGINCYPITIKDLCDRYNASERSIYYAINKYIENNNLDKRDLDKIKVKTKLEMHCKDSQILK